MRESIARNYENFIFSFADKVRDIKAERNISALVRAHGFSVQEDFTALVYGAEVEQKLILEKTVRDSEVSPVIKLFTLFMSHSYAGKRAFGREGNEYFPSVFVLRMTDN